MKIDGTMTYAIHFSKFPHKFNPLIHTIYSQLNLYNTYLQNSIKIEKNIPVSSQNDICSSISNFQHEIQRNHLNQRNYSTKPSNLFINFEDSFSDTKTSTTAFIDTVEGTNASKKSKRKVKGLNATLSKLEIKLKNKLHKKLEKSSSPIARNLIKQLENESKTQLNHESSSIKNRNNIENKIISGQKNFNSKIELNKPSGVNKFNTIKKQNEETSSKIEKVEDNMNESEYLNLFIKKSNHLNSYINNNKFNIEHKNKPTQKTNSTFSSKSSELKKIKINEEEASNRAQLEKLVIPEDWIAYVLKFGPSKYIKKSSFNQEFRKYLPYRADIMEEHGNNKELFPEDHPLHDKFTTNLDVYYNPKTNIRNNKRYISMSIKSKEKLYYSAQNVSSLLLHIFTQISFKKVAIASTIEEIPIESENKDESKILPNECIFCGRSNVGKSSIINALVERPVMLTSPKPGKTQSLHFYRLGQILTLVDLPGYGFAYEVDESLIQNWTNTIDWYLKNRGDKLKMVYLIADSRHGLKINDLAMIRNLLEANLSFSIILSKTDLEFPDTISKRMYLSCQKIQEIIKELKLNNKYNGEIPTLEQLREKFFCCSSVSYSGIGLLRSSMEPFMNLKKVARRFNTQNHPKAKFLKLRHENV